MILSILVMGCSKNQDYARQPTQPPSPAIGGGCSVTTENEDNQETKINYVGVKAGL